MDVAIKLQDGVAAKVRKHGMYLGCHMITFEPQMITCENEEEARRTHAVDNSNPWGRDWISKDITHTLEVEYLGEATPTLEKGVVLASFNAG